MSWSIRARLTAWYSLVLAAVLVTVIVLVLLVQQRLALQRFDGELERLMLTLQGVVRTELGEGLDLQAAADEASIEVVAPDRTLILADADGRPLAVWGRPLSRAWVPSGADRVLQTIEGDGARFRALSRAGLHDGHRYRAAVVAPLAPLEAEYAEVRSALVFSVVVGFGVAVLGGWVVGRQTLKPLQAMAAQATAISARDPSARLTLRSAGDELASFAAAFNGLLDRLGEALHAQRQFMADASHELRTPVSVVRTTAQVTLGAPTRSGDEYREALTIVEEQSTRLSRIVDSMFLLSRAEAEGILLVRERLYLDDVASECVRAFKVLAAARQVQLTMGGAEEAPLLGDDGLLRRMVGNLLDNAIRHAGPGGAVELTVARRDAEVVLSVADDGPGIAAADSERVFERFVRLDGATGGAGLGLPIARWIAEAHGGRLVLDARDGPGSRFVVTLPRG